MSVNIDKSSDTMTSDYIPITFQIPLDNLDSIWKHKPNPIFSSHIAYPKFSLGFQHYIHQSKNNMIITKDYKGKRKVYLVISKFERHVDDYDQDINNVSKKYFDLNSSGKTPDILTRAFYKLWELLFMFDLIDIKKDNIVTAHLAEGPGSFIQATMFYRDMYSKGSQVKNDKYYAITLHSERSNRHVPKLEERFVKYYQDEKPVRFIMHETYPKAIADNDNDKDNGDLTNRKTIKLFGGKFQDKKADFITADGGFDWDNENLQEQESFRLILAQIITALKIQAPGGNFVCKLYETFTSPTVKLIVALASVYTKVYISKPLTSRASNSEKYIVCLGFKKIPDINDKIEKLELILELLNSNKNMHLIDIFPDYEYPKEFLGAIIKSNTMISNKQYINLNNIIRFVNGQNFRGDDYTQYRQMQIDASKYWIGRFFPTSNEFGKQRESVVKATENTIGVNNKLVHTLVSKLQ